MELKHKIFRELKRHNGQSIEILSQTLGVKELVILNEIGLLCANGWLEIRDNKIYLRIVLDPIPEVLPKDWQYELLSKIEPIPSSYMNPLIQHVVHRDQADRGTCVGQACATWFDLNYIGLTNDIPTAAEMAAIKRNVMKDDGVVCDELLRQTFSAECIYQKSREIGNVTHPSGSYTPAGLRAMKEFGVCLESRWPTAKTPYAVYKYPPTDITNEVGDHVIDGYASISTFDAVKRAIYEHGAVLGSILVYDNYGKMQGGDGTFPSPTANNIGAHALCWIGYDETNLYCLHSWGDWCGRIGKISRNYFDKANLGFYTVLDTYEVGVLKPKYAVVNITCNVDADIWLDGELIGVGSAKASVLVGHTYSVIVEYNGREICDIINVEGDRNLVYTFDVDPWWVKVLKWLIEWMR